MSALDNRINTIELDFSGFVNPNSNQIGVMVLKSRKGPMNTVIGAQGEEDVIRYFGNPSSDYPAVFEAIEYARSNKIWLVSAYAEDARYAGVDVRTDGLEGWGEDCGRVYETFTGYSAIKRRPDTFSVGTGDGTTDTFTGSITDISVSNTIDESSLEILLGGTVVSATESGGVISGSAISSGTLNRTSGAFNIVFAGTPGSAATYTTTIDGSSNYDLSSGSKNKAINLQIDNVLYEDIDLGNSAITTQAAVVSAINAAVGSTVAAVDGNFITIDGVIADATYGNIRITSPTDLVTYDSAVTIIFGAASPISVTGTNPTGSIPRYNQTIGFDYTTTSDQSANVSHSFFAFSPSSDIEYGVIVTPAAGGRDFVLDLYAKRTTGYSSIDSYSYSLDRKKDGFGRSLYIFDVFKNNPYLIPYVNSSYSGTVSFTAPTSQEDLTGGTRGGEPQASDYLTAWNHFQKRDRYRAKNFLDALGNSAGTIVGIRNTYQPWAFCATVLPFGSNASDAITAREALALDTDQLAIYTNWTEIEDPYNNSTAWVSRIGAVGVKYAEKEPAYDALSPAGVDRNLEGGQILSNFRPIRTEFDYSDQDLDDLDNNQINPIVLDPDYGLMIVGDRTAKVTNSDTSYIGTRRLYNRIIDTVKTQVLRQQVFKLNNDTNQRLAYTLTNDFMRPILAGGYLEQYTVVCDDTNNTSLVKNQRKFILSIYLTATPNSQEVILQFVRLASGQVIADFLPSAA